MDYDDTGSDAAVLASAADAVMEGIEYAIQQHQEAAFDPVVQEISVLLSPSLAQQLYLLQYPLEPVAVAETTAPATPTHARMQPKHGRLELDVPLPPGINNDHPQANSEYVGITHRTFASQTIPLQTHMCLGRLTKTTDKDDNESTSKLHLVPLDHILQMRPTFSHVDEQSHPGSSSATVLDDPSDFVGESDTKRPVAFQRKESERAALARKSSYSYQRASELSETFQELTVLVDENHSKSVVDRIIQEGNEHRENRLLVSMEEDEYVNTEGEREASQRVHDNVSYIHSLVYTKEDGRTSTAPAPTTAPASNPAPTTPTKPLNLTSLAAHVAQVISMGHPVPFSIIRNQYSTQYTDNETLWSALLTVSVRVRGNLCLHSSYLSGVDPSLQRLRTFVLLLFETRPKESVQRKRLESVFCNGDDSATAVWPSAVLSVLEQVGRRQQQPTGGWTTKIDADPTFSAPMEVNQVWNNYWKQQEQRFCKELQKYDSS